LTFYQGFVGPGTCFENPRGIRLTEIPDGTSNTILVVEAGEPVPWSKPEDLPFDPEKPLPKLGGLFRDGFNALLCDGSVQFIPRPFDEGLLRLAITVNDGKIWDWDKLIGSKRPSRPGKYDRKPSKPIEKLPSTSPPDESKRPS
jgi:hypothetical protein